MKNQQEIELKWQKKWNEVKIFESEPSERDKFFGTQAYPYANSVLHIGHGKAYVTTDIFMRFQRLLGKNVLFPMGYHISGTPVLAVADGITSGDEKQIKITKEALGEYLDNKDEIEETLKKFQDPVEIAKFFSGTIEDCLKKVGIGIDWRRQFTTGEPIYNKFIEWQFVKLKELGILNQGKYPILFSPKAENAVGEDDIIDGDLDKVSISEMTYILFESVENKGDFFAVATLRPDALFGTTNLWIDKNLKLVKIQVGKQVWIVSKDSYPKFNYQFNNSKEGFSSLKIISEHLGEEFIGNKVVTPITNKEVIIANANFLDPFMGTGLAYSSPAGSPHDFLGLIEAKREGRLPEDLEVINTVETRDRNGNKIVYFGSCPAEDKILKFKVKNSRDEERLEIAKQELYKEEHYGGILNENAGIFAGEPIKKVKLEAKKKLIELGLGGELLETSRVAFSRNHDMVIVVNLNDQWFLDYTNPMDKKKAFDLLEKVVYLPEKLKATQKGYLEWIAKRPCARKRGLGTPLPYDKNWVIESLSDSTIYQVLYSIMHIIREEKILDDQLKPELFDFVYLGVGDLDKVSKNCNLSSNVVLRLQTEANYWNGCDLRSVGQPHMSNHLTFLIYHYALIFQGKDLEKFHPKKIVVGGMLGRNGEKISKSKGNGIALSKIGKEFGVDLYRLYIATAANFDIDMDFRDSEVSQLEKKFDKFSDLMIRAKKLDLPVFEDFSRSDKWLVSRFYSNVKIYFLAMERFSIREAYIAVLYEMLNDISYHTRVRSEKETLKVLRFIFKDYLLVMTPAIPHICEEIFEGYSVEGVRVGNENFISLEKFETNPNDFIDKKIEEVEGILSRVVSEVSRLREKENLQVIKKVRVIQATKNRFELFDNLGTLLNKTKDFKEIFGSLRDKFASDKKFIAKFVPKTLGDGGLCEYLSRKEEKELILSLGAFIRREFGADLEVVSSEESECNSLSLVPGKPIVVLE